MKSIFWTQNSGVFEEDTLYIDELNAKSLSIEEITQARDFLYNFPKHAIFSDIQFDGIIERYQLPQNFKYLYSEKLGSFVQGVFEEMDDNGRHMPFIVWSNIRTTNGILDCLNKYAKICGKTISSTNMALYKKAIIEIRKEYTPRPQIKGKIIVFCLTGLVLLLLFYVIVKMLNQ